MTVRLFTARRVAAAGLSLVLLVACWRAWAQPPRRLGPIKPLPAHRNVRYGPHERNVLDVWRARPRPGSSGGTPIVVFFHGGGFRQGDKASVPARLVYKC